MKNPNELDENRLGTTDRDGHRVFLYPKEVQGKWKVRREYVYGLLILIYLIVPWTKMNGQQTLLFDIPGREFFIFGNHFYAHDIPLFFAIVLSFIIAIAFLTALLGRVWCGWACPQSVFIEGVFRKIELFIEGNHMQRKKLDSGPWTSKKVSLKTLKWLAFLITSLAISHSFLAYFVRTEELIKVIQMSPEANSTLFMVMLIATGVFLFDFGWFREQFCIIACPYGRFQSVFMDEDSMVVAYDVKRGEPRKVDQTSDHGDCVNCYACVQVCPTGIDIRRGTQLECIHCTRCIDACDEIMDKVEKPRGLIRYSTERILETGVLKILRPRVIIYSVLLSFIVSAGSYFIWQSKHVDILFVRGTRSLYQLVATPKGEKVVNHFKAELFYRAQKSLDLKFKVPEAGLEVVSPVKNVILMPSRKKDVHVFFRFDREFIKAGSRSVIVSIYDADKLLTKKEVTLQGPYGNN